MKGDPDVLIVADDPVSIRRWSAWLEQSGCNVLLCRGPRLNWTCPRLDGEPCPRRELADVAVVAVPAGGWGEEPVCTKIPDDGTTVLLSDSDIAHHYREKGIALSEPIPALLIDAVCEALVHRGTGLKKVGAAIEGRGDGPSERGRRS